MGAIFKEFEPDHWDRGTVVQLMRRWESKMARKTKAAGTLSLIAVSLAACGSDDDGEDSDGDAEVAAFNFEALEEVAGAAAELFVPWFDEDDDSDEGGNTTVANDSSGGDTTASGRDEDAPANDGDAPSSSGNEPSGGNGGSGGNSKQAPEPVTESSGFDIILADLFSGFGSPQEGALTAQLLAPEGPILEGDLGLLGNDGPDFFSGLLLFGRPDGEPALTGPV